jgi:hypothetical protein
MNTFASLIPLPSISALKDPPEAILHVVKYVFGATRSLIISPP